MITLKKEVLLGHITDFLKARTPLGMYERMAPTPDDRARGEPANLENGETTRYLDPAYWTRKTQAEDLKNVETFLQQGLLSTEGIKHFDAWKEDIPQAIMIGAKTIEPEHRRQY